MTDLHASPLGHATTYRDRYDPALLFPVDRAPLRAELGLGVDLPFTGEDIWTAYELSWLRADGKPDVAIATLRVPAISPRIVESKSVKLYLTALNQTAFGSRDEVVDTIRRDLAAATGSAVAVELIGPEAFGTIAIAEPAGTCLDAVTFADRDERYAPEVLACAGEEVEETLFTRLFRSVCPVTGQPDYASVEIAYRGARLDHEALLRYLVSFRREPGFHEQCVERIFMDVWQRCAPRELSVYARFTRRGGIDINPVRASRGAPPAPNVRTARQ